ncbi:MAG: hypothetical protein HXY22_12380 [Alphaproteobacteria bacterium]|nr:hypothetical protein [Alphaproteobacteria bacterium]
MNTIEMIFSKVKGFLRKAAARTLDTLWNVIAEVLETLARNDCTNRFIATRFDQE